ncbi:MAG: PLP-dependent aminotransferase family protein [Candidatus Obscuribacterales bacterium]|nr:PLP-dependent aminotransferase family protein [Candidatus Obscuribacterales bacterium]
MPGIDGEPSVDRNDVMQLLLTLPQKSSLPVYIQVAEAIKESINRGVLKPGDRLPSIRELAASLKLARLTINRAYEHLSSQSYIDVLQGSGTFVSQSPPLSTPRATDDSADLTDEQPSGDSCRSVALSAWAQRLMKEDSLALSAPDISGELNYNAALLEVLPINLWRKALFKSFDMEDPAMLSYTTDPLGFAPLREALAQYLARARNLRCSPDQIAIFCNTESGTDKLARILLQPADLVGVEEPGSPGVRTTFLTHASRLLPVSVDEYGIVVNDLIASGERPRLIYITPSHHDPTGVALSLSRREMLLDWAKDKDCFIIEDDYDCEYYYGQRTLAALFSMDQNQQVIYRFNFWKSLFPLVRIGFLVLPKKLVPVVGRAKMLTERDNSLVEQKALATFMSLGYFERHLSRTRTIYESRRAAVILALTRYCKKEAQLSPTTAGTHILASFSPQLTEENIISCAAVSGVPLISTRKYYSGKPKCNEFIIGFATLNETETDKIFREFARLLRQP